MGLISFNCPHCGTTKASFETVVGKPKDGPDGSLYAICVLCRSGVVFEITGLNRGFGTPEKHNDLSFWKEYEVHAVWPEQKKIGEVGNLPPNVNSAFVEAEKAFQAGLNSAAGGMYRKAIERSLKTNWPDLKGSPAQRIKKLGEDNILPSQLIDLLNVIRFLGNGSLHDEEDPTQAEVAAAKEFTTLFLTYTFEMPNKVAAALKRYEKPPDEN